MNHPSDLSIQIANIRSQLTLLSERGNTDLGKALKLAARLESLLGKRDAEIAAKPKSHRRKPLGVEALRMSEQLGASRPLEDCNG